jgi:hypothetical protein
MLLSSGACEGWGVLGWRTNLLRTSRVCPQAYRVAVWCSRQNPRDVYGWLSGPYAEARTCCRAPDIGPTGVNVGTLTGIALARAYSRGSKTHE